MTPGFCVSTWGGPLVLFLEPRDPQESASWGEDGGFSFDLRIRDVHASYTWTTGVQGAETTSPVEF